MNKRLDLLYEMIPSDGLGVIDVGTDHGQIPIRLAKSGYSGNILASDVAEGPLNTARTAAHSGKWCNYDFRGSELYKRTLQNVPRNHGR